MNAIRFEMIVDEAVASAVPKLSPMQGRQVELIVREAADPFGKLAESPNHLEFEDLQVDSLGDLTAEYAGRGGKKGFRGKEWIFRGQQNAYWPIESTLFRAFRGTLEARGTSITELEDELLRKFKKAAHLFLPAAGIPGDSDRVGWWALMQHYGAPTRLIDWTYSFYIATFFAVEGAEPGSETPCAVWAYDSHHWNKGALSSVHDTVKDCLCQDRRIEKEETIEAILADDQAVFCLGRARSHERLLSQQGVFLLQANPAEDLLELLQGLKSPSPMTPRKLVRIRIPCMKKLLWEILEELDRMNINRGTLFPGLQGYAASLRHNMPNQDLFSKPTLNSLGKRALP